MISVEFEHNIIYDIYIYTERIAWLCTIGLCLVCSTNGLTSCIAQPWEISSKYAVHLNVPMELKSPKALISFRFPKGDVGLRRFTTSLSTPKAPSSEAEQQSGSYHGCKLESIVHRRAL